MTDFIITRAVIEDAEGILNVQKSTWVCTYPNPGLGITYEDIKTKADLFKAAVWRKNIEETGVKSAIFVAKIDGKIVGFSGAMHEDAQDRITAIYVLPDNHKKGVGSSLMNAALDFLKSKRPIVVEVVSYNEKAIRFYEKFGFKKHKELEDELGKLPSGKIMPEIEMIKKLI